MQLLWDVRFARIDIGIKWMDDRVVFGFRRPRRPCLGAVTLQFAIVVCDTLRQDHDVLAETADPNCFATLYFEAWYRWRLPRSSQELRYPCCIDLA